MRSRGLSGNRRLFRLTDPHLPDHLHPAVRATLDTAGRTDLLGHVAVRGRRPDQAEVSPYLQARCWPLPPRSPLRALDHLPADALDFEGQTITNCRNGATSMSTVGNPSPCSEIRGGSQ